MTTSTAAQPKHPARSANAGTPDLAREYARASITFETARWSKVEEVLESLETEKLAIRVQVAKGLLRKRVKVSLDGPVSEVDGIIRMVKALGQS